MLRTIAIKEETYSNLNKLKGELQTMIPDQTLSADYVVKFSLEQAEKVVRKWKQTNSVLPPTV